jgi:hypothetical protein
MSKVYVRALCFSLAIIIIMSFNLVGCSGGNTTEPSATGSIELTPTPESTLTSETTPSPSTVSSPAIETPTPSVSTPALTARDIIDNTKDAWALLSSYAYDFDMVLKMSGTISGDTLDINMTMTGDSVNNLTVHAMQMNADVEMESPGEGKISMPMVLYLVNGWEYIKISVPFAGDQWMKTQMDIGSYDAMDDIQHALGLGQSGSEATLTGTEEVDGVSCYVLQIDPDPAELSKWLSSVQQTTEIQGTEPTGEDLSDFVKNLSYKEWIAKDSYLLKKSETVVSVTMNGADFDSSTDESNHLNMDISQVLTVTEYNQPVSIILPPESQDAQDTSQQ